MFLSSSADPLLVALEIGIPVFMVGVGVVVGIGVYNRLKA